MEPRSTDATGWVGWIAFAGVMLVLVGTMQAMYGLIALFNDEWAVWGNRAVVYLDITAWGWVHLVLGVLVTLVGVGVVTGNLVARVAGVVIAALSMWVNFLALPVYPVWSVVLIAINGLVIYALIAHGREVRA